MSLYIGVWLFLDAYLPSKEVLCTSTMLRRYLLARVRCWWFRIQLFCSVTHIKTLVWNALSSSKLPACSRHSMSGRRAQREQGTAASWHRDIAIVPRRAWTAQRCPNPLDSKLSYPPALLESGKGQCDLLQLSHDWWWPSHNPWTSHSILQLENLHLKE